MSNREFHSFQELAKAVLPPEETLRAAWRDIQCACSVKPQGLKRKQKESEQHDALERAIATLRRHFPTSQEFRKAIPDWSFASSSGIAKQPLYHFANKWEAHDDRESTIEDRRKSTAWNTEEVFIYRKNSRQPVSQEEVEKVRMRKQQRKEYRMKNEQGGD